MVNTCEKLARRQPAPPDTVLDWNHGIGKAFKPFYDRMTNVWPGKEIPSIPVAAAPANGFSYDPTKVQMPQMAPMQQPMQQPMNTTQMLMSGMPMGAGQHAVSSATTMQMPMGAGTSAMSAAPMTPMQPQHMSAGMMPAMSACVPEGVHGPAGDTDGWTANGRSSGWYAPGLCMGHVHDSASFAVWTTTRYGEVEDFYSREGKE